VPCGQGYDVTTIHTQDATAPAGGGRQDADDRVRAEQRRHRLFHRPVIVQTGRLDRERVIASTRDAAAVLLHDWPLAGSARHGRAMEACLSVIHGETPPSVARRAFVAAAREAKVLIGD